MSLKARYKNLFGYLKKEAQSGFNYEGIGTTATPQSIPPTYNHDHHRVKIGEGRNDFERAKLAIQSWRMFPDGWTEIAPDSPKIHKGEVLAMFARFAGVWWRNSCQIVYIVDEPTRYGFAYGTLPDHIARGEELFMVEIDNSNYVWYEIRAFSRPRYWLAKLGYPFLRIIQAVFRRQSGNQMKAEIQSIYLK